MSVTGHEFLSEFGAGDIANLFHIRESSHQFVGGERHGEKEFIVFTSVECGGIDVHAKLFGGKGGLIIDRNFLFIDSAAHAALFADVHQFGRESVADVNHGCRENLRFLQGVNDVAACLGFEDALDEIFSSAEVRLCDGFRATLLSAEHTLFAFKELKPEIGGTEVSADADEVGVVCSGAFDNAFFLGFSETGDADCHAGE